MFILNPIANPADSYGQLLLKKNRLAYKKIRPLRASSIFQAAVRTQHDKLLHVLRQAAKG